MVRNSRLWSNIVQVHVARASRNDMVHVCVNEDMSLALWQSMVITAVTAAHHESRILAMCRFPMPGQASYEQADCQGVAAGQVVGFVLAIAATLYATMNSSMASSTFSLTESINDPDEQTLPYRLDFFHLAYMLASAYLAMLFTGWSLTNVPGHFAIDSGWISVWVKMASQWLCALLYGWTLVAPVILKSRQF